MANMWGKSGNSGRFYFLGCVCVSHSVHGVTDSMDCSPPGFSVHGILQARIVEWVAISFSSMNFSGSSLVAKSCLTLATPQSARFLCPWDSPGKNTGVGCHFLLQKKAER